MLYVWLLISNSALSMQSANLRPVAYYLWVAQRENRAGKRISFYSLGVHGTCTFPYKSNTVSRLFSPWTHTGTMGELGKTWRTRATFSEPSPIMALRSIVHETDARVFNGSKKLIFNQGCLYYQRTVHLSARKAINSFCNSFTSYNSAIATFVKLCTSCTCTLIWDCSASCKDITS